LRDAHRAYNTQINDLLLAALALAFARWTGSPSLLLDLEGHGRDPIFGDVDLSRTVGWFTSIYPVPLSLDSLEPSEALKSVKERLRSLPDKSIEYGMLRYLCEDNAIAEKLRELPNAEVSFLYVGQINSTQNVQEGGRPLESSGATQSPSSLRPYILQISASIKDGCLSTSWTYSENLHRKDTIERLALSFMESLRAIIDHCLSPDAGGFTPSDLPEAGLSQQELDAVLSHLGESD
jgi:non-ribosomal peptide synthase protein (TIGR01720 family)